jgi:hypothetical protein
MKPLRAGPVSLFLDEDGSLRRLTVGGHEIARRIMVAVRDRHWGTVPSKLFNLEVKETPDSFEISFDAQAVRGDIDFAWRGTANGSAQGAVSFSMDGEARSTFLRNRIGLCVLHPVRECAGAACTVEHSDGGRKVGSFPRYVWPHQPFKDIRVLWHAPAPGLRVRFGFEGDVFEMEDQRNWSDASFKTYSTPLAIPFPVEVPRGTRIRQSVALTLEENAAAPRPAAEELSLAVDARPAGPLPPLGLSLASHGFQLRPAEFERLKALRPAHLRADLVLGRPDWPDALRRARSEAEALDAALELAVHLSGDAAGQLDQLLAALGAPPRLARVLVFHESEKATSARWLREAKQRLAAGLPGVPIGGGTDSFFAELNRAEPPKDADVIAWSVNPQVHEEDDLTLVENLEGQSWTVESAKLFAAGKALAVTPVTLRPRGNPNATGADAPAAEVDPRQWSLFGAAWTAASLGRLAGAGASSLTYYETAGARGVMDRDPRPVYPLYHVLADFAELAGGQVLPVRSSDPLRLDGFAAKLDGRLRVVAASLSPEPRRVSIRGLPPKVRVRLLSSANAPAAGRHPETFRASPGAETETALGRLDLDLSPWGVARIDA